MEPLNKKSIECPISAGELVDKITILEIKQRKIVDKRKLVFLKNEISLLEEKFSHLIASESSEKLIKRVYSLKEKLQATNISLWEIEEELRGMEKEKNFGEEFIRNARQVYLLNDLRFSYKDQINKEFNFDLREVKSYG